MFLWELLFIFYRLALYLYCLATIISILNKLMYDGEFYRWCGSLNDLKCFVKEILDIKGKWSSPGGDAKLFRVSKSEFVIKWHGPRLQKIVVQADNPEQF